MKIPFNLPANINSSREELMLSLDSGSLAGRGPYTKKCQDWFKNNFFNRLPENVS